MNWNTALFGWTALWDWTFSRAIPLIDEAGVIVKWFGAASDITERVEAEAALRESEEKYRSLFESMNEGLAIMSLSATRVVAL
ncbi:hypothetical protein ANSO36C_43460 [Nostoc cf. commune SO-36]|uniref:PAC domain-containing protein n=1 Tax=Nostoc cf. commune SO-36 TaxID=449208 RepID=A0ABN6Q9M2_NOSCO|nr:hypothetical protein [Nostoc commune]BDI18544.1 hypothetical protein ANSO36C_43460 [Nostoc cf. commune SO-36]